MKTSLAFISLALLLVSAQGAMAEADGPEREGSNNWATSGASQSTSAAASATNRRVYNSPANTPGSFNSDGYYTCTGAAEQCEQHKQQVMAECAAAGGDGDEQVACRIRATTGSVRIDQTCDDYVATGKASSTAMRVCNKYADEFLNAKQPKGYVDKDSNYVCTFAMKQGCPEEEYQLRHACEGAGDRDARLACHIQLSDQRKANRKAAAQSSSGSGWADGGGGGSGGNNEGSKNGGKGEYDGVDTSDSGQLGRDIRGLAKAEEDLDVEKDVDDLAKDLQDEEAAESESENEAPENDGIGTAED